MAAWAAPNTGLHNLLTNLYFNGAPPPETLTAPKPTVAGRIQNGLAHVMEKVGYTPRHAQSFAGKATGFANDVTPVGGVIEADKSKDAFENGSYGAGLGHGLLAVVNSFPDAGPIAGKGLAALLGHLPEAAATKGLGAVLHSIIAPLWHGSDKKFAKFADDFIGSGEGAQGYGYGHYLTESKRLANNYRNPQMLPNMPDDYGHLYKVSVNAEPHDFVDLDVPLIQQPPVLQDIAKRVDLSSATGRQRKLMERFRIGQEQPDYLATGQNLHNVYTDYGANTEANKRLSEALSGQGFAGFRYGQPKSALGGGGRNYVVFDPSAINILDRH